MSKESPKSKIFLLIDSYSLIHRAYHALPPLTNKKGQLLNAVYGFLLLFLKSVKEFDPEYIMAAFDFPAPTFRHKEFKEYKATRVEAPEDLYSQVPKIKEVLAAFNVPIIEKEGYEADDIIGTASNIASQKSGVETIILSGDLDTLQLVSKTVKVCAPKKGVKDTIIYDPDGVKEKFGGLTPSQMTDYKALKGDVSDNIPGVQGIGEKTAINLLNIFPSLEKLYEGIRENEKAAEKISPRIKEILLKNEEKAFFSKKLVQLDKKVPIDFDLKDCEWKNYDEKRIEGVLQELEFSSLIDRLPHKQKEEKKSVGENLTLW